MTESFTPRVAQEKILAYTGGYMGISAVPGSGKTFTLSLLAAQLVQEQARHSLFDDREVLVVTFTNNAVENFRNRIAGFLRERDGLLPGVGYRVRTLHGLAHDIVRERPSLAGLSEDFAIIDAREANAIIRESVTTFLRMHPDALAPYVQFDLLRSQRSKVRFEENMIDLAKTFIRTVKDERLDASRLRENLKQQSGTWPLLDFGLQVYEEYQRGLSYRGAVDFDDLIVFSVRAMEADSGYLKRLQDRWPYVLEDEAQDSSSLQETLLRMLTAYHGNWVRVGDPNQAINTTFTSARASYLQNFIEQHPELSRDLPNSGRCAQPIIDTANTLIDWSRTVYPKRVALSRPLIQPTPPGDPQPNPPADESEVHLFDRPLSPDDEIQVVVESLERWLKKNPHRTVAVLALTGTASQFGRVFRFRAALHDAGLPYDESLLSDPDSTTRAAAGALASLFQYLARPEVGPSLAEAWIEAWWPYKGERLATSNWQDGDSASHSPPRARSAQHPPPVLTFEAALKQLRQPEDFLFPVHDDWLNILHWMDDVDGFRDVTEEFRTDMQRWTRATILPVDELILTVGNELFAEPAHLALTHHLAVHLAKLQRDHTSWRLPELARELQYIVSNRLRLPDFDTETEGYEPKPGVVTLATVHGAKGLEWDRVYLTSANSYDFPSGSDEEQYRSEPYYARDKLNLGEESLEQLRHLDMGTLDDYSEGTATVRARQDIAAERLRLFYVGITRARRELIVTYNTGQRHESNPLPPAVAFLALMENAGQAT